MFSKAKQKQQAKGENHPPQGSVAADSKASTAAQAASKRSSAMKSAGVPSIISADVVLRGNVNSAGEVQLDGALEGDIRSSKLIVGEQATVKGEIICEDVIVRGRVEGGIRAKKVSLASTSRILGDILHSSLSVESGAHFEGNCRHSDDPLSEASANDFRKPKPTAPKPLPSSINMGDIADTQRPVVEAPSFLNQSKSPLR